MKNQIRSRIRIIGLLLWFSCSFLHAQWQFLGSPESCHAIGFDAEGDTLMALTTAGLFFSVDDATSWQGIPTPGNEYMYNGIQIENGVLYLTVYDFVIYQNLSLANKDVYRSDDWGVTWLLVTGSILPTNGLRKLLISQDTVYFIGYGSMLVSFDKGDTYALDLPLPDAFPHTFFFHNYSLYAITTPLTENKLIRSNDLGSTWETVDSTSFITSIVRVSSIENVLWKTEYSASDTFNVIYSSIDHGETWTIMDSVPNSFLLSAKVIGDNGYLFLVDDIGTRIFFSSSDIGASWQHREIFTESSSPLYVDGLLLMANEYGIFVSDDLGNTFSKSTNGVSGATVIDFAHSGSTLWVKANHSMYDQVAGSPTWNESTDLKEVESTLDGHLIATIQSIPHRSADGGITWTHIPPESFDNPFYYANATYQAAGNLMYCVTTGDSTFYSQDYGVSWEPILTNHWTNTSKVQLTYQSGKYLALDSWSHLWVSDDGISWESLFATFPVPVSDLDMLHYQAPYFFTSSDTLLARLHLDSSSWEMIMAPASGNTFPLQPSVSSFSMQNHGNILLAAFYGYGVFASQDYGDTWYAINHGLDHFQSCKLSIIQTDLYLGVDGGVWRRPLSDLAPFQYEGITFKDLNANGQFDPGETGTPGVVVRKISHGGLTYSGADGSFLLLSDNDEDDLIEALPPSPHATITTAPIPVSTSADSLYFGVYYTPGVYDAVVILTNTTPLRPGFESDFTITYRNKGTEPANLEIYFAMPTELEFISSTPSPSFIGDTLIWSIQDVLPGESGNISIIVRLHETTPIGTIINVIAFVPVGENGDYNPADNVDELSLTVVGSFDPNDKAVFPAGYISPAMIADTQRLEYTIRFQNTGNYPATFVRIQDTLSSHLDLATLEILSASHFFTWKLLSGNVLDVYFENIYLPDSTNDERGSHGFVKFAINAKTTLQLADQIENKAYIYFDYNVPVVTNTVGSTVGFETGIQDPGKRLFLSAFPVPTSDFILVNVSGADLQGEVILSLFDSWGNYIKGLTSSAFDNIQLDVCELPSGIYFLHACTYESIGMIKILKH